MDYEVIWSPEALDDIDGIAEFHSKTDVFYAQIIVEGLIDRSRALQYQPLRGRYVPELAPLEYREVFCYSYRLIYRVDQKLVEIIAAIPGKIPLYATRFTS
jgi:toxin ParE1/3/4